MSSGPVVPPYPGPPTSGPDFSGPALYRGPEYGAPQPGAFPTAPGWGGTPPVWPGGPPASDPGTGELTDEQLHRLPPPAYAAAVAPGEQRPAVVGLAVSMAVTASLLWICGLSLGWLVAVGASDALDRSGSDGVVFHLLDGLTARLSDGLAAPLYLFPLLSCVSGFLLLRRRPWPRIAHTVVGVVALGWSAWWLRDNLLQWAPVALYVGVAVAVLWTRAAGRWYAGPR